MLQDDGTVNWHEAIKRLTEWVRPRLQEPADADELVQEILARLNRSTRHWDTAISAKARVPARLTSGSVRILCGPV